MRFKALFLIVGIFLLSLIPISAQVISDSDTYQFYKGDAERTGIAYSSIVPTILNFSTCSITRGQNYPAVSDDFDNDGKNEFLIYSSNFLYAYNENCNSEYAVYTNTNQNGIGQLYDLFANGKQYYVVPEDNGNITVYSFSDGVTTRRFSVDGNGTENVEILCEDVNDNGQPYCHWVSNSNYVCTLYNSNPIYYDTNYTSWTRDCTKVNSTDVGFTTFKRSLALTYSYSNNPLLVFPHDWNNDNFTGIVIWDINQNEVYQTFRNSGYFDNLVNCTGQSWSTCMTVFPNDLNKLELVTGNIDINDGGTNFYQIGLIAFTGQAGNNYQRRLYSIDITGTNYASTQIDTQSSETADGSTTGLAFFEDVEGVSSNDELCFEQYTVGLTNPVGFKCYIQNSTVMTQTKSITVVQGGLNSPQYPITSIEFKNLTGRNKYAIFGTNGIWDMSPRTTTVSKNAMLFNYTKMGGTINNYISSSDVTGDGIIDFISTESGSTNIHISGGYTSTPNSQPVITGISPSKAMPVKKNEAYYYTLTATDSESDYLQVAVKCKIGNASSPSSFSSGGVLTTAHSLCSFDVIGCYQSRVWVTDNQDERIFATFDYEDYSLYRDFNVSVRYSCGDGVCNVNEQYSNCPADCYLTTCGNNICDGVEIASLCPRDCLSSTCGNAICEMKETYSSCPADCTISTCGNGYCNQGENSTNCPYDNLELGGVEACGDTICAYDETYLSCPADCPDITCGNGLCDVGENFTSCPIECKVCGNGICETGETRDNCAEDCAELQESSIPLTLVDVNSENPLNPEQTTGLLPELYIGVNKFFSSTFVYVFGIMFVIGVALFIIALIRKGLSIL